MSISDYTNIRDKLLLHSPSVLDVTEHELAAVAMILAFESGQLKMFFIERAPHKNDPWSGQIAFPGGGKELHDQGTFDTACRETHEEVGICLDRSMMIGRLDDQKGKNRQQNLSLIISCFVFFLSEPQAVVHNNEVGKSFWIPVDQLIGQPEVFQYYSGYSEQPYPAIRFETGEVLWGLTYRFVQGLARIAA
ncbi:MAG: NUDIX domain-containing protein [Gammaproteobacteria bacterium]|nr:NUDIX domain-containing protein [Gammaproteobacteria bacterium]